MEKVVAAVAGALALVGLGALAWSRRRGSAAPGGDVGVVDWSSGNTASSEEASPTAAAAVDDGEEWSPYAVAEKLSDAVRVLTGTKVLNRDFAARDGVRVELLWLLDEWERDGTHVVRVREKSNVLPGRPGWFPSGAVRWTEDEQQRAAQLGLSGAGNLDASAHGPTHRAALDVQPDGFNPNRSFSEQPGMFELVETFAYWAEGKIHPNGTRFRSGRGFLNIVAPDGVKGDWVHVEIVGWDRLPPLPPSPTING